MEGAKVFVYRNLREHRFTVRDLESGEIRDVEEVWLSDAQFRVSQPDRLRALREKKRSIHAGVVGTLLDQPPRGSCCDVAVRYNPNRWPFFLSAQDQTVHTAPVVHLKDGQAFIPREDRWL